MTTLPNHKTHRLPLLALLAVLGLGQIDSIDAQTRGKLSYDSSEDAGFMTLWNRQDNRIARLFVAGSNDEAGELLIYDNDDIRIRLGVDGDSEGRLILRDADGQDAAKLGISNSNDDAGELLLYTDEEIRIRLGIDAEDQGRLILLGSQGQDSARIGISDANDEGLLWLYDAAGLQKARLEVIEEAGRLQLLSTKCVPDFLGQDFPDNLPVPQPVPGQAKRQKNRPRAKRIELDNCTDQVRKIVTAERLSEDDPDHGRVRVWGDDEVRAVLKADAGTGAGKLVLWNSDGDATITLDGETGTITVNGTVLAAHHLDSSMALARRELAPAEPLVIRGSAKLENGRARITLPDQFSRLANRDDLTVQLTPNSADTAGLATVEKSLTTIQVAELGDGNGEFTFDYVVHATPRMAAPSIVAASNAARNTPSSAVLATPVSNAL